MITNNKKLNLKKFHITSQHSIIVNLTSVLNIGDLVYDGESITKWTNEDSEDVCYDNSMFNKGCFKVVASIGEIIDVPSIKGIDYKTDALLKGMDIYTGCDELSMTSLGGFIRGYSDAMASSERKYTEEDLREAFYKGRDIDRLDNNNCVIFSNPTFEGYLREENHIKIHLDFDDNLLAKTITINGYKQNLFIP